MSRKQDVKRREEERRRREEEERKRRERERQEADRKRRLEEARANRPASSSRFDMNTDYKERMNQVAKSIASGGPGTQEYKKLEAQRKRKLAEMAKHDYKKEAQTALAAGDREQAAQYQHLDDAKKTAIRQIKAERGSGPIRKQEQKRIYHQLAENNQLPIYSGPIGPVQPKTPLPQRAQVSVPPFKPNGFSSGGTLPTKQAAQGKRNEAWMKEAKAKSDLEAQVAHMTMNPQELYEVGGKANQETAEKATALRQANLEKQSAQKVLDVVKMSEEYDNLKLEDKFTGQSRASYIQGRLGQESAKAWTQYLREPTDENRQMAEAIDQTMMKFQTNNAQTLDDDASAKLISQDLMGYLPQLVDQAKYSAAGTVGGAALGGLFAGPGGVAAGAKLGHIAAQGTYSANTMAGAAFRNLISQGVDEETARAAAMDEAIASTVVEMGDAALDVLTLGHGGVVREGLETAAKKLAPKKLIEKVTQKVASKVGSEALEKTVAFFGKHGINLLGRMLNVAGEATEEFLQEGISAANEERYLNRDGRAEFEELGQYGQGNIDLLERPKVQNEDGSYSTVDSFSFYDDRYGKEILIPTVIQVDGEWKHVDEETALKHFDKTGEFLGAFDTPEEANAYAEKLHRAQDYYYSDKETGVWDLVKDSGATLFDFFSGKRPDLTERFAQSARGGAAVALLMNLGGGSVNVAQYLHNDSQIRRLGAQLKANYKETQLIEEVLDEADPESQSYQMAAKLKDSIVNGGATSISDRAAGQLYAQVQADAFLAKEQETEKKPATKAEKAAQAEEQKQADLVEQSQSADPEQAEYATAQLEHPDETVVSPVSQTLIEAGMDPAKAVSQADIIQKIAQGRTPTRSELEKLNLQDETVRTAFTEATGIELTDDQIKNSSSRRKALKDAAATVAQRRTDEQNAQSQAVVDQEIAAEEQKAAQEDIKAAVAAQATNDQQQAQQAPFAPAAVTQQAETAEQSPLLKAFTEAVNQQVAQAEQAGQAQQQTRQQAQPQQQAPFRAKQQAQPQQQTAQTGEPTIEYEDGSTQTYSQFVAQYEQDHPESASAKMDGSAAFYNYQQLNALGRKVPGSAPSSDPRYSQDPNGATQRPPLSPRRQASIDLRMQMLNNIGQQYGITVEDGSDDLRADDNGYFDPTTNTLRLNTRKLRSDAQVVRFFLHELTHGDQKADAKFSADVKAFMERVAGAEAVQAEHTRLKDGYTNKFKERGIKDTSFVTDAYIDDELTANFMMEAYADPKLLARIAGEKPGIIQRLVDLMERGLEKIAPNLTQGRAELKQVIDRMHKTLAEAQKEKLEAQGAKDVKVDDHKVQYSIDLADAPWPGADPNDAPVLYSKMAEVISEQKQNKFGAASLVSMLRGKGVKQEEIKWSGLIPWLEGKKSVTKEELQQFIDENALKLDVEILDKNSKYRTAEYKSQETGNSGSMADMQKEALIQAKDIAEQYGLEAHEDDIDLDELSFGETDFYYHPKDHPDIDEYLFTADQTEKGFSPKWQSYALPDGENYREILLKDPNSEYSNTPMVGHWAELGRGVLVHARVQDFDGTLFIDEIQSDWHNIGRKVGYEGEVDLDKLTEKRDADLAEVNQKISEAESEIDALRNEVDAFYERDEQLYQAIQQKKSEIAKGENALQRLHQKTADLHERRHQASSSEELRSLREQLNSTRDDMRELFDKINTAEEELTALRDEKVDLNEHRPDIFAKEDRANQLVDQVHQNNLDLYDERNRLEHLLDDASEIAPDAPFRDTYHELMLKYLIRMAADGDYSSIGWTTAAQQDERWKNPEKSYLEGYRIEYDQDIPKFLRKYGKQWGATVGKTTLPNGEEVWAMNLPDSMKQTVKEKGQVRYSMDLDSEGRELTPEQKNYFAESKAVDNNGQLLTLFRGQRIGATKFKPDYRGAIWTSTRPDYAERYGDVDALYANVKNPYLHTVWNTDGDTVSDGYDIDDVIRKAKAGGHDGAIINFQMNPESAKGTFPEFMAGFDPDSDAGKALSNWTKSGFLEPYPGETIGEFWKRANAGPVDTHVVVFNPNQLKSTSNKNPTGDPDIRYSIDFDDETRTAWDDEQDIDELTRNIQEIDNRLDEMELYGEDDDGFERSRLEQSRARYEQDLNKLYRNEQAHAKKTPISDLLAHLDEYRPGDLRSLADQISGDTWDEAKTMPVKDLREAIREELTTMSEDLNPLEMQAPKFGFFVRPPEAQQLNRDLHEHRTDNVTPMRRYAMDLKDQQNEIIQKANPAIFDDHTWIRSADDIKNFDEATEGLTEGPTPDYTLAMINSARESGKIRVYSSHLIEPGAFVTPSKMEAQNYAGSGKLYSKTVPVNDVAWIDEVEGQYARVVSEPMRRYAIDPDTGFEEGSAFDQVMKLMKAKDNDAANAILQQWVSDAQAGKVKPTNEAEQNLYDTLVPLRAPVTPEEAAANRQQTDALIQQYGAWDQGENAARPVFVPKKTRDDNATSKFVRTVEGAKVTPPAMIAEFDRAVVENQDGFTHDIATDKQAMNYVDSLKKRNYASVMTDWDSMIRTGKGTGKLGMITKKDIALGEYLYTEAAKAGDTKTAMKMVAELSLVGTEAGRTVQAMHLLRKMTPAGKLYYLQGAIDRMNKQYERRIDDPTSKMTKITLDPDDVKAVLEAKTVEEAQAAMDVALEHIAEQVPVTFSEKWNAWRYLAMLGNPRTHVRNLVSNAVFSPVTYLKDMVGAVGELSQSKDKRTKNIGQALASAGYGLANTLVRVGTLGRKRLDPKLLGKYVAFADADFNDVKDVVSGGGKYNPADIIRDKRKIWRSTPFGWLNKASDFNSAALEAEDVIFLRNHYTRAMSQFLAARGADVNTLHSTPEGRKLLKEARSWATLEAQKATFRDASAFATALSSMERSGAAGQLVVGGLMPFKKTPLNILKRGAEYTPAGAVKAIIDTARGKGDVATLIDGLASSFTGTGIMAIGAYLMSQGLLRSSGDKDKDQDQFDKLQGAQNYSFITDNGSYTIDWAAPAALPLFIGANLYNAFFGENTEGADAPWHKKLAEAMMLISEPMFQLSVLSGLNDTLSSIKQGDMPLSDAAWSVMGSYFGQVLPTLGGQVARIIDPTRHSAYIDANSPLPDKIDYFLQSSMGKIPGVSQKRSDFVDAWGQKQIGGTDVKSYFMRALQNFLNPGYYRAFETSDLDQELQRLYTATKDNADIGQVLPRRMPKYFNVKHTDKDGNETAERVDLNAEQWETFQTVAGQTAESLLSDIINSEGYKDLPDALKAKVANDAYIYAKEQGRHAAVKEYDIGTKWVRDADKMAELGFDVDDFILAKIMAADSPNSTTEDLLSQDWLSDADRGLLIGATYSNGLTNEMSFTDPNRSNYEFVLDSSQARQYEDHYDELWKSGYDELLSSEYYQNGNTAAKAEMINKLQSTVATRTKGWMAEQLGGEDIASTPAKDFDTQLLRDSAISDEVIRLYDATNDSGVLPKRTDYTFSSNGTEYRMTPTQWTDYQQKREDRFNELLPDLMQTSVYRNMTDVQKAKLVSSGIDYADDQARRDIFPDLKAPSANAAAWDDVKAEGVKTETLLLESAMARNSEGDKLKSEAMVEYNLKADWMSDEDRGWMVYVDYADDLAKPWADPNKKKHTYRLNETQQEQYEKHYRDLWLPNYIQLINSYKYQNGTDEEKAKLTIKLRGSVAKDNKDWMSKNLHSQGIEPVPND